MYPLRKSEHPDAPTRLAKQIIAQDRFRTPVYHLSEPDLFITINYSAKPESYNWIVVTSPNDDGEIEIALYDGRDYIGVVEIMDFYGLTQSEQWLPRIGDRFMNW